MLETLSQAGHFKPIHDAHAIEQVVFILQFDRLTDDTLFMEIAKAAEQFQSELPGRSKIQGLNFLAATNQPVQTVQNSGIAFRKVAPDGAIENELRIDRDSIVFKTTLYSRWNAAWSQASKYFNALVSNYAAQARLTGITINYVDKFEWIGDITKCRPSLLLRPESKYLCSHVFEQADLWHSHTGAFIRVDQYTKRLLNVNIDFLDESRFDEVRRVVAITTVLTDQLNQQGYDPYLSKGSDIDIIGFIDDHMMSLHVFGKKVFGNIINDEMSKRIALIE